MAIDVGSSGPRNGFSFEARSEMPKKPMPRMIPIETSVRAALRDSGRWKAGTPLDTASTPESATAPDEKARSSMKTPSVPDMVLEVQGLLGHLAVGDRARGRRSRRGSGRPR